MEAMAAQQMHEQQLVSLSQNKHKKRLQLIVGIVSGVFVLSFVGGGVLWKRASDERARERAALEAQARTAQEELERLKREATRRKRRSPS